jgi:hypothetical protein
MRFVLLLLALSVPASGAETPSYDSALAIAAGRAYIESYRRWHPLGSRPAPDWNREAVEYVPTKHGGFRGDEFGGYIGVFVPDSSGDGGGFAYFEIRGTQPGDMFLCLWGYLPDLSQERERFQKATKNPDACTLLAQPP